MPPKKKSTVAPAKTKPKRPEPDETHAEFAPDNSPTDDVDIDPSYLDDDLSMSLTKEQMGFGLWYCLNNIKPRLMDQFIPHIHRIGVFIPWDIDGEPLPDHLLETQMWHIQQRLDWILNGYILAHYHKGWETIAATRVEELFKFELFMHGLRAECLSMVESEGYKVGYWDVGDEWLDEAERRWKAGGSGDSSEDEESKYSVDAKVREFDRKYLEAYVKMVKENAIKIEDTGSRPKVKYYDLDPKTPKHRNGS